MRIGIETDAYFHVDDYESGMKKAKSHGYDCLDYGAITSPNSPLWELSDEERKEYFEKVAACAKENGLEIFQMHGLWFTFGDAAEEDKAKNLVYFKKQMDCAVWLGCPRMVIHPRMAKGWVGGTEEEMFEDNVRFLNELLPYAKEKDIILCMENMPLVKGVAFSSAKELKRVVDEINDPHVKICLDTGHQNASGEDLYETILLFGKDLECLHVHDDKYGQDRHLIPFQGQVDWEKFIKGLQDISFGGCISLETAVQERTPEPMREQLQRAQAGIARWLADQIEKKF